MTKTIDTLVEDMYSVVDGKITEYVQDHLSDFGSKLEKVYNDRIKFRTERDPSSSVIRLSAMGTPCTRKLWYKQNDPSELEPLDPAARLKFLFGDVLEELLLQLARDSGHTVEGEQDEMEFAGVKGHRDCVIDGVTIDCKSSSSFAFKKFKEGLTTDSDSFGYLTQLGSYVYAAKDDPIVTDKQRGGFLVIDKQFGHIHLDLHTFKHPEYLAKRIEETKAVVLNPDVIPLRSFKDVKDGAGGNRKLDTVCSYCEFKHNCWDNLRTFIYSTGPRYLTQVVKEPNVYEEK